MVVRKLGGGRLVLGLMLGVGIAAFGGKALGQVPPGDYAGDAWCKKCHSTEYDSYMKHGHSMKLVHTGGTNPPMDLGRNELLDYPWGQGIPALPANTTWDDVAYVMRGSKGAGTFYFYNLQGYTINADGSIAMSGYACGSCHTTGYSPTGHQLNLPGITGTWALEGIQCERCHGAGNAMTPNPQTSGTMEDGNLCNQCHGGSASETHLTINPSQGPTGQSGTPVGALTTRQGDELIFSPHKEVGCAGCHDPHKSVWHDDGGVLYATAAGDTGSMCKACHKDTRVRGAMGDLGIECVDCHMAGTGRHVFRINTTSLTASANSVDSGTKSHGAEVYYYQVPADGNGFLTLDLVCTQCHANMTPDQMAQYAAGIHRQPGLIDLTVNGQDTLQVVKRTDFVTVSFSIDAGAKAGMKATSWVVCQTPRGWQSWNGKMWKAGFFPCRKKVPLADVANQNVVIQKRLAPGYYTYWVCIATADGSQSIDSVPVYVTGQKAPRAKNGKTSQKASQAKKRA